MATAKPDMTRVWANGAPGGNVEDPDVTVPGKFDAGWLAEIPPFENFNFLQKLFTQGLAYFNEQGIGEYDALSDYPIDARAKGSDGELYRALIINGPATSVVDPVGDLTGTWEPETTGSTKLTVVTSSDAARAYTAGTKSVIITAIGAGAGAGGADGQGAGTATASGAGSGGGFSVKAIDNPTGTLNITVGAGGVGGAAGDNDGTSGGDTTVVGTGINITAEGGISGDGHTGTASSQVGTVVQGGGSSGGDINGSGLAATHKGIVDGEVSSFSISGCCPKTGGGVASRNFTNGVDGSRAGEGGGASHSRSNTSNNSGGDGFRGEVHILEFF